MQTHLERSRPLTRIPAISLLRPSAKVRSMVHAICSHYKRLPVQHIGDEPIFLRIRHAHSSASKALTTHSCAHLIHTSSNRLRAHSRLHKNQIQAHSRASKRTHASERASSAFTRTGPHQVHPPSASFARRSTFANPSVYESISTHSSALNKPLTRTHLHQTQSCVSTQ
jgi:hypothetical protein